MLQCNMSALIRPASAPPMHSEIFCAINESELHRRKLHIIASNELLILQGKFSMTPKKHVKVMSLQWWFVLLRVTISTFLSIKSYRLCPCPFFNFRKEWMIWKHCSYFLSSFIVCHGVSNRFFFHSNVRGTWISVSERSEVWGKCSVGEGAL